MSFINTRSLDLGCYITFICKINFEVSLDSRFHEKSFFGSLMVSL